MACNLCLAPSAITSGACRFPYSRRWIVTMSTASSKRSRTFWADNDWLYSGQCAQPAPPPDTVGAGMPRRPGATRRLRFLGTPPQRNVVGDVVNMCGCGFWILMEDAGRFQQAKKRLFLVARRKQPVSPKTHGRDVGGHGDM